MKNKEQNVADFFLNEIVKLGVEYIFLVPGAQIVPLYKAISKIKNLKAIVATHELAAGFMAIGYARVSGKMGVVMSTGAPGAIYMTGAGITAKADDVPVLFVTGNIPKDHHGRGEFQDASAKGTNDSAIFKETVGESIVCSHPEEIANVVIEMVRSKTGFKPLHIQIPVDVQIANIDSRMQKNISDQYRFANLPIHEAIPDIHFEKERKIVFFLGRKILGVVDSGKLIDFVQKNEIGVVTDMKARGVVPETYRASLGYVGFNSDFRALEVLNKDSRFAADQIFAIGVTEELIKQYIDPSVDVIRLTPGALKKWLDTHSSDQIKEQSVVFRKKWLDELLTIIPPKTVPMKFDNKVSYLEMFEVINEVMPDESIYCLDAGQMRRAGSMLLQCHYPRSLIQSDTLSPMGSGICAAVGAQLAVPDKPVIALFGDGSMRMHGMELATAVRYNLPIIFIVCDNQSYISLPQSKTMKEMSDLPEIDWLSFATSLGMKASFSDNREEFQEQLTKVQNSEGPSLLWVTVPGLLDDEFKQTKTLEYKNWLSELKDKL